MSAVTALTAQNTTGVTGISEVSPEFLRLQIDAVFEDIYERLNDMLFFCGYCELDPRNPFDWVILYCIYVEDLFDIDPKIQQLLGEVFREQE